MASTYLTKTFAQAGNRRTFTISYWIKMGQVSTGADQAIMGAAQDGSNSDDLYIHTGRLNFSGYYGSTAYMVRTTAKYRDLSGWYHHVIRFDSTQSTASDRLRLYVNGELQTALDNNTYPSQNLETTYFNTARQHTIGSIAHSPPNLPFNGSMSHFHFCDGYSYGADSFGETDTTTGIWKPKTGPSVSYGTNGFFLKFENSASMGTDSSGNSNNFTVNGSMTQTIDTPSNVFATFNPLSPSGSTYSNCNNDCSTVSGTYASRPTTSTLGVSSGKYYTEIKLLAPNTGTPDYSKIGITGRPLEAVTGAEQYQHLGSKTYDYAYNAYNGNIMNNTGSSNNGTAYGNTYTTNDIIGIALDLDNNKLYFSKNGTWQNSGDPTSGATGTGAVSIVDPTSTSLGAYFFGVDAYHYTPKYNFSANFGNGYFGTTAVSSAQNPDDGIGIFEYDVPAGYRALCTKSINAEEYS